MESNVAVIHRDVAVGEPLSASEIRAQVNRIQEVMREVMEENVHYGKIPGTPKPSLWKPGAEKISMTFHIAVDPVIDADLSTHDVVRYRIRAEAKSQSSGVFLGAALGECSSDEEKYKWRRAVCDEEFDATSVDRRRHKWKADGTSTAQVRTEPADIANTVLKMGVKRAVVAVILQVTAASDIFTQDIEDMPEEIRDEAGETQPGAPAPAPAPRAQKPTGEVISEAQRGRAFAIGKGAGLSIEQYRAVIKKHGFSTDKDITKSKYEAICAELKGAPASAGAAPDGFN